MKKIGIAASVVICLFAAFMLGRQSEDKDPVKAIVNSGVDLLQEKQKISDEQSMDWERFEEADLSLQPQKVEPSPVNTQIDNSEPTSYDKINKQLKQSGVSTPPSWFYYDRNVYDEVAAIDPQAVITEVKCVANACRVDVQHQNSTDRDNFSSTGYDNLMQGGQESDVPSDVIDVDDDSGSNMTTMYEYPEDDPTKTVMYVIHSELPSAEEISNIINLARELENGGDENAIHP